MRRDHGLKGAVLEHSGIVLHVFYVNVGWEDACGEVGREGALRKVNVEVGGEMGGQPVAECVGDVGLLEAAWKVRGWGRGLRGGG